jgi:hypothetical protein
MADVERLAETDARYMTRIKTSISCIVLMAASLAAP